VLLLVVGGVAGWAVTELLHSEEASLVELPYTTAVVAQGEVSRSLTLNASAEWEATSSVANRAIGTVTSVDVRSGAVVAQGQKLYSVDLRPVHVAQGTTPMHRDLQLGASGPDVAQLQQMLITVGFEPGDVDGVFDVGTVGAVRSWQSREGIEPSGAVALGDIVFVPELPIRISIDPDTVYPGAILAGGERAITGLGAPRFTIALDDRQAELVPSDAAVVVQGPSEPWGAVIERVERDENGAAVATLGTGDSAPVCGDECAEAVGTSGTTLFSSQITLVPHTSGLTVPAAAVSTDASGVAVVVGDDGAKHSVTVVASAQGMSVVEGVPEGMRVRVPFTEREG